MILRNLIVAACVATSLTSKAFAQPAPAPSEPPAPASAVEEGQRGLAFYGESRWQEAFESFSRAEQKTHSPVFVLYMARSLGHLGRLVEAAVLYRRVLDEDTSNAPPPWRQARLDAGAELTALRERIPAIEIRAALGAGDVLTVDGKPAKPLARIELDPGPHEIVFVRAGRTAKKSVALRAGDALTTVSFDSEPKPGPREGGAPPSVIAGGVLLGTGIASLVAGAITGGLALKLAGDVHEVCDESAPCPVPQPELQPDIDEAKRFGDATTGLLVAGGALAATGLVLVLVRPGAARATAIPSAYVMPAGPGLVIGGSF